MNYKVNLSDVIKVVIFVAGLVGTWYSMKYEVDYLNEEVKELKNQLRETNLGVIKNDIEYIKKGQEETQDDLQQYYNAVNEFITVHTSDHD
jgi:GTPase involved in cell partitioning and DNA repair